MEKIIEQINAIPEEVISRHNIELIDVRTAGKTLFVRNKELAIGVNNIATIRTGNHSVVIKTKNGCEVTMGIRSDLFIILL